MYVCMYVCACACDFTVSGSNDGWIYDPDTKDYGWVMKKRTPLQGAQVSEYPDVHAYSDLVRVQTNATDGDWAVDRYDDTLPFTM